MNTRPPSKSYSIQEYLEFEATSELKHEYENGLILEMSGGTINHGVISDNIYNALRQRIRKSGSGCKTYSDNIKVRIEDLNQFVYPDAMVICGGIERSDKDAESVTNPKVIVEVLSKSTVGYDRGDKFHKYRQLDSFQEYILIDQYQYVVETFYKNEQGFWEISRVESLENELHVKSFGFSISMSELYEDTENIG